MDSSGFRRLFWGFLFTMLDFRIMGIDILPDILGYIFFLTGLSILGLKDECFQNAKKYCIALIVLSIFFIYSPPEEQGAVITGLGLVSFIIGIAETIINLILVYNICEGVKNLTYGVDYMLLHEEAQKRWQQYIGLFIASLAVIILVIIPPLLVVGLIFLIVYSIVLVFLMTGFMARCRKVLEDDMSEQF